MISSLQDLRLIVIADDPLARAGLAAILAAQAGCQIVGQAASDSDWSAEIETSQPDVVVWDLGWTPAGPLDRLSDQRTSLPPVLVLLPQHDAGSASAAQAWQAGARGLLPRNADPAVIAAAAHSLAQGLVVLDIELAADLLAVAPDRTTDSPVEQLTPREHEVLQLLAEGMTNRAIAQRLDISEHTVKFHVNAILGKLGAQSRTDAVMRATRLGMIVL
ncbi:MAG: response regulator transcription factor [Anaerolineales bacterium]|nr:response regulator transcription factor [Anaerolineales bacterium]